MYEAVDAYPDGASTAARYAATARQCGFDGVVVRARNVSPDYDRLQDSCGIDVVDGVEIVADSAGQVGGLVGKCRPDHTLVLVRGGTTGLNRFAAEQDRIDVLTRPTVGDGDVDHALVAAARDHGVRIEIDLGPVLRRSGGRRVQALKDLRKLRELVADADAPYVVSATPRSHLHLRSPRELRAVGDQIGFDADAIQEGLTEWGRLAERNRERLAETTVESGVWRGQYGEEGPP